MGALDKYGEITDSDRLNRIIELLEALVEIEQHEHPLPSNSMEGAIVQEVVTHESHST